MQSDRTKWDAKHAAAPRRPQRPAAILVEVEDLLPRAGRALDVACGRGRNALWLAERGLDITAVDVSPVALARVAELATSRKVSTSIRTIEHDLDEGLPARLGTFDVVLSIGFHAPSLWPALRRAVRPSGLLVLESLARDGNEECDARYLATRDDMRSAAGRFEVLRLDAGTADRHLTVRLVARRPYGATHHPSV